MNCSLCNLKSTVPFSFHSDDTFDAIGAVGGCESLDDSLIYVNTYMADIMIDADRGNAR